jgi:pyruvate kinase
MVARGDLGLAVGYTRLPEVQEQLVDLARRAGKPVVVATQVLEIFAETGLPQRAELWDLSLIARQRADAVMLGKETVFSARPLESIRLAQDVLTHETRRFEASVGVVPTALSSRVTALPRCNWPGLTNQRVKPLR